MIPTDRSVAIKLAAGEWVDVYGPSRVKHLRTTKKKQAIIIFHVLGETEVWREWLAEKKGISLIEELDEPKNLALTSCPGDAIEVTGAFRYTYVRRLTSLPNGIRYSIQAPITTKIRRDTERTRRKLEI